MTRPASSPAWPWVVSVVFCVGLLSLPLLMVTVPPITDLPQQVAQMRLLDDVLASDRATTGDASYRVQWWHPNKLGYLPLYLGWKTSGRLGGEGDPSVGSPFAAGRWALMLLASAWVVAIHGLARAWGRPLAAAMLASVFFFNHITYWGFVSFLTGVPAFLMWLWVVDRTGEAGRRRGAGSGDRFGGAGPLVTLAALLLYAAHVLWLAVGLTWLALDSLVARRSIRALMVRGLWASPAVGLVAAWYPRFAASGFDSETHWGHSLVERLRPDWLVSSALGGLQGLVPTIVAGATVVWGVLGVLSRIRSLSDRLDARLLLAAGLLGALAFGLPGVHQHTIFFASRWLPAAAILLLLGAPSPAVHPGLRRGLAALLVATLSVATANTWMGFERVELEGFLPAIHAVPAETRLLGLDFVRQSARIRDYPFYHLYAYAQARGGGTLNRSFADQASSLVVFHSLPKAYPWTRDLDWKAHLVREADLAYFDHVLAFAPREIHAQLHDMSHLEPLTPPAPWRLYRVHEAQDGVANPSRTVPETTHNAG